MVLVVELTDTSWARIGPMDAIGVDRLWPAARSACDFEYGRVDAVISTRHLRSGPLLGAELLAMLGE